MKKSHAPRPRVYLTLAITVADVARPGWEHLHFGIASHDVLNRADLPAVSNAWGLLLLPPLGWFPGGIALRVAALAPMNGTNRPPGSVVVGFFGALLSGVLFAVSFAAGYENAAPLLLQCLLLAALALRVYRAECVPGFVLGMAFTFGAILPTTVAATTAVVSAIVYRLLRPSVLRVWVSLGQR